MRLTVQSVGGSQCQVNVKVPCSKDHLYGAVASALSQPQDRLKLVCKGQSLQNENHIADLRDGDHLLAMTVPRPPSAQVYEVANAVEVDSDDEAVRFRLAANAAPWKRAAVLQLRQWKCPEVFLVLCFQVLGWPFWMGLAGWLLCARLAARLDLGPIFLLGSIFALIALNLGRRRAGQASAYSIFNGLRRMPGQLTAEDLDQQIRRGNM